MRRILVAVALIDLAARATVLAQSERRDVACWADGAPVVVSPQEVIANTPTVVTITHGPLGGSHPIQEVRFDRDPPGRVPTGVLHDDGSAGDTKAGDQIYGTRITLTESYPGTARFLLSVQRRMCGEGAFLDLPVRGLTLESVARPVPHIGMGKVVADGSVLKLTDVATLRGPALPDSITVVIGPQALDPFRDGEEVVLFLTQPGEQGRFRLSDGALSVYHVVPDETYGKLAILDSNFDFPELAVPLDPEYLRLLRASRNRDVSLRHLMNLLEGSR